MTLDEVRLRLPELVAQIGTDYPEVAGVSPTLEEKRTEVPVAALRKLNLEVSPAASRPAFLLTFRRQLTTEDGQPLLAVVRATLDDQGRLVRVTCSKNPPRMPALP